MRRNSAASCVLAVAIALGAPFAWAQAQTGDKSEAQKLTEIQNAAMKAFQQGNWGEAASGFEKLLREAEALLRKMLANGPVSLRFVLEAVNAGLEMPFPEAQYLEATLFGLICTTDDMKEGTKAFLEKRPPQFRGR